MDKLMQNATDGGKFVHAFPELVAAGIEKDQILGPVSVPAVGACSVLCRFISGTGHRPNVAQRMEGQSAER
jgi:hypothetical protein